MLRFPLEVVPPVCTISTAGGSAKHSMVNKSDRRMAFVISYSPFQFGFPDCSMYWVNTTYGFIDAGESKSINIWRDVGASLRNDRLKLYFCPATCPDALEHFQGKNRVEGSGELAIRLNAPVRVAAAPPSSP